jgi:hypothetical protein
MKIGDLWSTGAQHLRVPGKTSRQRVFGGGNQLLISISEAEIYRLTISQSDPDNSHRIRTSREGHPLRNFFCAFL